jgi:hypothetical protein
VPYDLLGPKDIAYAALAANPVGGLLVAIPFAILELHYPLWVTVVTGVPLAYLQVLVVDLGWNAFAQIPAWKRFLDRRRSTRVERLVDGGGAFWITFVATPFLGPWLVMAFLRYAQVRQSRVAFPILAALTATALVVGVICVVVPDFFAARRHAAP